MTALRSEGATDAELESLSSEPKVLPEATVPAAAELLSELLLGFEPVLSLSALSSSVSKS